MPNPVEKPAGPPTQSKHQQLDRRLFHLLGAGHQARPVPLAVAVWLAHWSWIPLLALMFSGLPKNLNGLAVLAQVLLVAGLVQVGSKRLSRRLAAHRPFMEGLSPNHLHHSERAGFPSTHATVMGAVCGFLLLQAIPVPVLVGIAAVTLSTGWARVYAGAHYPLDVLAGLSLGAAAGLMAAGVIAAI